MRSPTVGAPTSTSRPSPPHRRGARGSGGVDGVTLTSAARHQNTSPFSVGFAEATPQAAMEQFLESRETTLRHLLDGCAEMTANAATTPLLNPNLPSTTALSTSPPGAAAGSSSSSTTSVMQHRARVVAELLRRDKDSQWVAEVGRNARLEGEKLRRATDLEAARLLLAQRKNLQLRARLEALTRAKEAAAAQRGHSPPLAAGTGSCTSNSTSSSALVMAPGATNTQLAMAGVPNSGTAAAGGGACTNKIVEARRRLDQRTRELQEAQAQLRQLQELHLGQLSGQLRPTLFVEDVLRTTENFLDTETSIAVRATVVDALLEVNQALKPLSGYEEGGDGGLRLGSPISCLESIHSLWDRLAVQNFVVGRVNRLFTCMCPTAPPLTLLKDANMM